MKYITLRNIVALILSWIISTAAFLGLLRVHDYEQAQHNEYVAAWVQQVEQEQITE
ncbi:hypothetical protein [Acinetobacter variabilis]|mgnify:CR=1 FL=1|uniref:Uncharacterized protein n=1 Tax=Acinetobacter variabilis TaxID=70346 RepID=N8X1F1_9GAMM|nr:hypothetical protein [Acinetobacter variabilis]ENV00970.1 hypothetical protein F969_00056 [Acinetobacter variabilis]MCU4631156.1 hypothetical protein [Acinetobacter variabilis]